MSRPRRRRKARAGVARYAAPAAFLLAVTIAVLLIRAGLNGDNTPTTTGSTTTAPTTSTSTHGTTTRHTQTGHTQTGPAQYYTVQSGDTFGSISAKTGVPVSQLESLNPSVSSNSLQVGQRVRVK
jgi:LysM repeat protein